MKDITIRYLLKPSNIPLEKRTEPELVYAEISGGFVQKINGISKYNKFQFSLECKVQPKYFGSIHEKRDVKYYKYDNSVVESNKNFNKQFRDKKRQFENNIDKTISYFTVDQLEPTREEFKNYLTLLVKGKRKIKETFSFLAFLINHIKQLENLIGSGQKNEIKNTTINAYRNLIPILTRYEEATKSNLTFASIDEKKYREIWQITNEIIQGKVKIESYKLNPKENGLANNTIKLYQTYFLLVCKEAKKGSIQINLDLNNKDLINSASKDPSLKTQAYLTESDLEKIISYQSTSENLLLAKNYIILASMTGMRYQSMKEASGRKIELFKNEKYNFHYLHTKQIKTGTECFTPLFARALQIIKENDNLFPDFNDQRIKLTNLNKNIRLVLKNVEITNSSLISSHNCRSTFVTNLIKLNFSETTISLITHPDKKNSRKSTHLYNRTNMLDNAKMFADKVNEVKDKTTLYHF